MGGYRKLFWLGALCAGALLALLLGTRAQAAAAPLMCAATEGFVPAFCVAMPTTGERRDTTVTLTSLPSARADVRVEPAVPGTDASAIAIATDRGMASVEARFGRTFSARPRILVFATPDTFARGVRELFGYSAETADAVATRYAGIFDRGTLTIAINRSAGGLDRMAPAIAHELTHLMIRDVIGPGGRLPTWLDEGLATVVEQQDLAASADERVTGRALAATHAVPLASLDALADWHAAYPRYGRALYAYAAEAARVVAADVDLGTLLEALAAGESFEDAYERLGGRAAESIPSRVAGGGAEIVATPDRGGAVWTLSTGTPGGSVEIAIDGGDGYHLTFTVTTDALGMYRAWFGSTAAPGTYTVRAAGAAATFVTTR